MVFSFNIGVLGPILFGLIVHSWQEWHLVQSSCILAILLVRSEENAQVFLPKELPLIVYFLCKPNRLVCGKILAYLAPIAMPHSNHITFFLYSDAHFWTREGHLYYGYMPK